MQKKTKQNKKQLTTVETEDGARLTSAGQTKNYTYRYFTEAVEKAFKYERKIKINRQMWLRHRHKGLTKITADFESETLNIIHDLPVNVSFKPTLKTNCSTQQQRNDNYSEN